MYSTPTPSHKPPLKPCDQITVLIQCGSQAKQTIKGRVSILDKTAYVTCPCCGAHIEIQNIKPNYLRQDKVIIGRHTLTYVTYTTKAYDYPVRQLYVS